MFTKQHAWNEGVARITSYGNGAAYKLENTESESTAYLQGDEATAWREDYDAACDHAGSFAQDFVLDTINEYLDTINEYNGVPSRR